MSDPPYTRPTRPACVAARPDGWWYPSLRSCSGIVSRTNLCELLGWRLAITAPCARVVVDKDQGVLQLAGIDRNAQLRRGEFDLLNP